MSKILAFDQRSHITGWAFFEDSKLIKYGKITTEQEDIGKRLVFIKNKILDLVNEFNPDEIYFEDIQLQNNVGNNVKTFKILAEVFGVLEETFTERGIPHTEVLAASWKSTLGIKGKARAEQKKNAQEYVINTYGIKPTQDECDAICIGAHAIHQKVFDWS